jgi:hypothetical protein
MAHDRTDPAAEQSTAWSTEEKDWTNAWHAFVIDRFGLVQSSARFWLGTMTTLVALLSALIVVNRGEALSTLPVGTLGRTVVYLLVALVYVCAFGAVVRGSQACFGGLSVRVDLENTGTQPSDMQPSDMQPSDAKEPDQPHDRGWLSYQWNPDPLPTTVTWENFRNDRLQRGDDARRYLHQSRGLGVGAVGVGIVLARWCSPWAASPTILRTSPMWS